MDFIKINVYLFAQMDILNFLLNVNHAMKDVDNVKMTLITAAKVVIISGFNKINNVLNNVLMVISIKIKYALYVIINAKLAIMILIVSHVLIPFIILKSNV
jgi:hypothetical protein